VNYFSKVLIFKHLSMKFLPELSAREQKLIRLCRENRYCRIQNLRFCNGEPSFRPPPKVESKIRLGQPRRNALLPCSDLTELERELLETLRQRRDGTVLEIDVREGQPCDLKFEQTVTEL